jgi:SH3-like domain-containing protein
MQFKNTIFVAAMTAAAALSVPASAATLVSAMTPLNIRTGPGPQYGIVGAIPDRGQAVILGCIQNSLWCEVSYNGRQGWVYSQYLTASLSGRSMIVAEHLNDVAPAVNYRAPVEVVGSAAPRPAITGTLVARPATAEPLVIAPPPTVRSYVVSHPVAPVYLNGEVVEGAGLPDDVALAPVPDSDYDYAYVNNVPVLVEPSTRRVEYMYR